MIKEFIENEEGATLIEYVFVGGIIMMLCATGAIIVTFFYLMAVGVGAL